MGKREGLKGLEGLYRKRCGLLFGGVALVVVLLVLFGGDGIGLSNNGDFIRVMRATSLYFDKMPAHTYVDTFTIALDRGSALANVTAILFGTEGLGTYPSIQVLVVRLSVLVNLVVNKLAGWEISTYHIQVLGIMHALLYAAGIGFLLSQFRLKRLWKDVLVKSVALMVLCDIGYVAYFNSFYGEALEHIALIWCAAMLVRVLGRTPTVWDGVWCAVCAVMYGWAKFFNIPLAVLVLLVLEGIVLLRTGKRRALAFGAAGVAILLAVWTAVPSWIDIETNYNAVFYGVVRGVDQETAEDYLEDLGLPAELADYRDTHYYLSWVEGSLAERGLLDQAKSVTKPQLIRFYLTHPGRLWEQAKLTALHSGMIRPFYLANFGEGYPLMTFSSRMSLWSLLRDWSALDTLWGCFAVTGVAVAMAVVLWRKRVKPVFLALPLLCLVGGLCFAFLMPVMLNGEGDFAKHMFAYGEIIDLLLIACLGFGLEKAGRGRQGGVVCPALAVALALVLVLPPAWGVAQNLWRDSGRHTALESGAYVRLGSYGGKELTWLVAEETAEGYTLLCMDERISAVFDQAGENAWAGSSLRVWLNGEFLTGFTPEERALLITGENPVILPDRMRDTAERGDLDFAFSHIAILADRLWERTWQTRVADTVSLPGIDLVARLAREGRSIAGTDWWLETPYGPHNRLVRYVGADGHIYLGDALAVRVVRPTVEIRPVEPLSGSGSRRSPFVLE